MNSLRLIFAVKFPETGRHLPNVGCYLICLFIVLAILLIVPRPASAGDGSGKKSGELDYSTVWSEATVRRIPKSDLNLILTGVIEGRESIALISVDNAREEPFAVGKSILPGVKLAAVGMFSVVINRDGVLERLELQRRFGASGVTNHRPREIVVPGSPPLRPPPNVPEEAVQALGDGRYTVMRSAINDQMRSGNLFIDARMVPQPSGGFTVSDVVPGSLYDKLGLTNGDRIVAINEKPLKSIDDALSLYQQWNQFKNVQIQVIRDGNPRNMQFDLQ